MAAVAAYWRTLPFPFVFDDYVHLSNASKQTFLAMLQRVLVEHPSGGDMFFRPLGYVSYWLTFRWAGFHPFAWHSYGLLLHAVNTLLVYWLCRRVFGSIAPALTAGLVFAWHGTHVEAVCWMAAQFDLLATLFVLSAMLFALEAKPAGVTLCAVLACLCKESAFALPLLIFCLAGFVPPARRKPLFLNASWAAAACSAVFLYRLWYLRGLGGYQSVWGSWRPLSLLYALLFRIWSFLFIPINWSLAPAFWLALPLLIALIVALRSRLNRVRLGAALSISLCAGIPVFGLLLIGADMSGARILYLPSLGIALAWAVVADGLKLPAVLCAALACFELGCLWHNQQLWGETTRMAARECITVAQRLRSDPRITMYFYGLPRVQNGVFFLANGFPQCVAIAGAGDEARVDYGPEKARAADKNQQTYTWNSQTKHVEEVHAR